MIRNGRIDIIEKGTVDPASLAGFLESRKAQAEGVTDAAEIHRRVTSARQSFVEAQEAKRLQDEAAAATESAGTNTSATTEPVVAKNQASAPNKGASNTSVQESMGSGVEISEEGVSQCVEKGVYCYQADIDEGLSDYRDNSFDYVILNQTIQNTKRPDYVIKEVLRIGKKAIVSFPNFGYYRTRSYLMFKGTMPVSNLLPYQWYDSPNIHLLTIKDMIRMARDFSFRIVSEKHFSVKGIDKSGVVTIAPNLLAEYGFFVISSIES